MENGNQHAPPPLESIASLNVSEKMKENMRFVNKNLKRTLLGCPDYGLADKPFKDRMRIVIASMSFWAFFFNIFYYFAKGMWKKALALLAVNLVLVALAVLVANSPAMVQMVTLIVPVIASQCAYHDLYRKLVKQEDFWW